ncbi:DUF3231 family protein [Paenibacillus sp. Root444D2]|uniref:DUF3231 family protein n=1 Tax=Paenibacillus sp. Root444D2 TaxID=1736538 RepID=UPI00070C4DAB|nr:DUF3231 family protein [Paenibacillus sp. Root444D2]KQX60753.1 hypothetical protein ASD40_31150 [Paenibacillus sp. Root444D2]
MVGILEAAITTIKSLTDEEKPQPLHVGEVMACWIYLAGLEVAKVTVQAGINTTSDEDLKAILKEDLELNNNQRERLYDFMLKEGITLPPAHEDMPQSDPNSIPLGVKLTDEVLANELSFKIVSLILRAAGANAESIRTDFGLMFLQFQAEKVMLGAKLKQLMMKRGWIKIPPFYIPPGSQQTST